MHTTVLFDSQLVESEDVEPQIWRANCKVILDFRLCRGSMPLTPSLFKGQLCSRSETSWDPEVCLEGYGTQTLAGRDLTGAWRVDLSQPVGA